MSGRAMPRILVVDDEPDVVELVAEILAIEGFEPIPVLSGEAALEVYRAERPDAVLLDLLMPTMDGLGTLAAIRRIDPEARVAMLTAMGTQAAVTEALAAGARDFVLKPFDVAHVVSVVERLLAA
jgi:two-component system, chemotaxis family, chemotaxis protein CheY